MPTSNSIDINDVVDDLATLPCDAAAFYAWHGSQGALRALRPLRSPSRRLILILHEQL
tara:strand:- start:987 stop:1160 length:174 start_codon:yes stop_codon:yes gene_type:complete